MTNTRYILALLAAISLLCGCRKHEDIIFDTPYVRIEEANGLSSMTVDKTLDNMLTEIRVVVSASKNYFTAPIVVEYDTVVGDGLKEGVDFKIQASHASPLTFDPGTYIKPIRVIWYKTDGFDPSRDNTLTLRITGTNLKEMTLGLPGPDAKKKEFIFTKQ